MMCEDCTTAGDIATFQRDGNPDYKLHPELRVFLTELHNTCPGHDYCFCQHRLGAEIRERVK